MGTHLLPVADVCSKGQGVGDHVCAGGFDSTLVVASWYFCRSGVLPAWGLMCLGLECWTVDHGWPREEIQDDCFPFHNSSHGGDEYSVYIPPCWLALSEVLLFCPFGCTPQIPIWVWSDFALVGFVQGP